MKILVAHNAYLHRGGEDAVVDAEVALLRAHGHEVEMYSRHNEELQQLSRPAAALQTVWSKRSTRELEALCDRFQPDVLHVHNTLAVISPSIYWLAAKRGLPVVQTLHNFRLLCPQGMLLRQDSICEDCVGKAPWRAVTRKCYRDSTLQSAVMGGMQTLHRALGTYQNKVTRYIALNTFCRDKFIQGGLPANRICIKPNFVAPPLLSEAIRTHRQGGLFIGRLSPEKGLEVLADALQHLKASDSVSTPPLPLTIVGTGPLQEKIHARFQAITPATRLLGRQSVEQVDQHLQQAQFLIAPSICYETFGLVVIEAFACATPVIASRHGGLGELVTEGKTGLLFNPGDPADLAAKIAWARAHPAEMAQMGQQARAEYLARYTPERNHSMLINIYEDAISATSSAREGSCHAT